LPTVEGHYQITLADALSAHERALRFGGVDGIFNLHMIESAIARPYDGYHESIEEKATALVASQSAVITASQTATNALADPAYALTHTGRVRTVCHQ